MVYKYGAALHVGAVRSNATEQILALIVLRTESNATSQLLDVFHADEIPRKSPTEKQAELLNRLRRLESLVTELAAQVEEGADKVQPIPLGSLPSVIGVCPPTETVNAEIGKRELPSQESPMHFEKLISAMKSHAEGEMNEDFGTLVVGKEAGLQIGKGFWSVFCSEVEHIFEAIQDVASTASGSDLEPISSSSQISSHNIYPEFYFGNAYTGVFTQSPDDLYPLPSQMLFIWRTYVENVDPFIKVIDVAALEEVITHLRGKFGSLQYSLQALLFAVCLASITSLDQEETLNCFGMPRNQLLTRFRLGTERALANAGLLVTKDIETIQAFVIYLSILPHIGCQELLSPLMGLLLRIATSLQLHRDAENFKTPALTPVQVEIRRRIWWQIVFIDSISGAGHTEGLSVSDTAFDTKAPSRISAGGESNSRISFDLRNVSTICIMRYEIWFLCRFLNANQQRPLEQKLNIFRLTKSKLEDSYIDRFSSNNHLESLIKTMTLLAFSKVEHTVYLQHFRKLKRLSQAPSQEMMQHHLELTINILEEAHRLRTEPSWKKWRWQLQGDFPWASMSAVFIQLCQCPWSTASERGWAVTHQILEAAPDRVKLNPSWDRLSKIITAAEAHRVRNSREATEQTGHHNETCAYSFVETHKGSKKPSNLTETQSANASTLIDRPELDQVLMSSMFDFGVNLDEHNELESAVTFNPMEWQDWNEALFADDRLWDADCSL
ncbi:hypothetical protein FP744_10000753 [Trichoderma asperellum]